MKTKIKNNATALPSPRAAFRVAANMVARIENSLWGDAFGATGLFALIFLFSFIVGAIQ